MSDPGRVSPEDLEAIRAVPGCDGPNCWYERATMGAYHEDGPCDDCARLLYLAIASRVESATIEADAQIADGRWYGTDAAYRIRNRPRLYAEDK